MKNQTIEKTDFRLRNQTGVYHGKVRDVYFLSDGQLIMIASDRISAFDHILPRPIPFKGQVLNQIAAHFLENTKDICPNWLIATPDPNVAVGWHCEPIKVEVVVRGYLVGHAWRTYASGKRELCGVQLPENLRENEAFPDPIITPTTKADAGHDEDISREKIIETGLVSASIYAQIEHIALKLFERGQKMAAERGLILVDTKYEFGLRNGEIVLMDEIHTPDSSRYFYAEGYETRLENGEPQRQLSKEFVREWLMEKGFRGREGDQMPEMDEDFVHLVSNRYIELYEKIIGQSFQKPPQNGSALQRIETNLKKVGFI